MKQDQNKLSAAKQNQDGADKRKKINPRQAAAMAGIILLVLLYIVTLFVAIFDRSESGRWFAICIFATVAVPMLIWIYTWMYGKLTGRHTIADPDSAPQSQASPKDRSDTL